LIKSSKIFKIFKFFCKNNAGKNNRGDTTLYSKGPKKQTNTIIFVNLIKWDKKLTVTTALIRAKKKLFTLNKHISGSFSVKPFICGVNIGQYTFISILPKKYWFNELPGSFVLLNYLPRYSIFSNIFIKCYKKYALSNGTFCQVLDFFYEFNLIKIVLPSKQTKIVSG
jgi:hypothetical protein